MKIHTSFVFSALCALFLVSCTRVVVLDVFNNTGESVQVICIDTKSKEKAYVIGANRSQRVCVPHKLRITYSADTWFYLGKRVPGSFMKSERFGPVVVQMQVEESGAIYVLTPGTSPPVTEFPAQPDGYPLRPTSL